MSQQSAVQFQIFIAGESPNSRQALRNLQAFCDENLAGRYAIDVIDVFKEPERAMEAGVLLTPLTIKIAPSPAIKILGSLSNREPLLQTLERS